MTETRSAEPTTASNHLEWDGLARSAADVFGSTGEKSEGSELLRELLVFGLDDSAYAVSVERVREIVRMKAMTAIPRSPDWLLGVVALRGEVVQVIDLRRRLGLAGATLENGDDGVEITDLAQNSPAAASGLQKGDIIVGVNRSAIDDLSALKAKLKEQQGTVALKVQRGNNSLFLVLR